MEKNSNNKWEIDTEKKQKVEKNAEIKSYQIIFFKKQTKFWSFFFFFFYQYEGPLQRRERNRIRRKIGYKWSAIRSFISFSSLIYDQMGLTSDNNCEMKLDKYPRTSFVFPIKFRRGKMESHDYSSFRDMKVASVIFA